MSGASPSIALSEWLIREGRQFDGNREMLGALCDRLAASGVPLHRAGLHIRALHPRYGGVSRIWKPGEAVTEAFLDHGIERTSTYLDSPVRAVVERRERLDWRLDGDGPLPYPVLQEFRHQGYSHYVIAPLVYTGGAVNSMSWATRRPGGFTAADMQFLDDILPALTCVVELKALRRFAQMVLTTYVGGEPGRLILDGQIRRGDVRTITAALMLVDLRDFTLQSDRLSPRAVIGMLNDYFDCVMPPVRRHRGEVMEIMGDGVLAIFNQADGVSPEEACRQALAAATQGLAAIDELNRRDRPDAPVLQAGIALHYGTVSYGNIGSEDRLDFTVIGPDVNLTSRIERLCRELDRHLIMSEAFAATLGRPMYEIGSFELRGFARMQRLFELPPGER